MEVWWIKKMRLPQNILQRLKSLVLRSAAELKSGTVIGYATIGTFSRHGLANHLHGDRSDHGGSNALPHL
jgi:hypothetical protein